MVNEKRPKAMVVGLDGVPQTLIEEYINRGHLPNFKRILGQGHTLHQMDASIPDVSSTSWTSFMTGVTPAEHGIFGFMDLRPGTYQMFFPNSGDVKAPSVWEVLGGNTGSKTSSLLDKYSGAVFTPKRSVVMNIPQTYPATPINGVLTAGFVCPDMKKGTYPDYAYEYLDSIGYLPDVDSVKALDKQDEFIDDLFFALDKRKAAYEHFMDTEEWDLFIGVITETDRLHHFLFDAALDENHPRHEVFVRFYREMDKIVGGLYDRFREKAGTDGFFMTMSDHGFTVLRKEFYINAWMRSTGYLKLDKTKKYFEQIGPGTKAFAMDPARIYLNIEGKYPNGSVRKEDAPALVSELASALLSATDDEGNRVIRKVYRKDEIYDGVCATEAPDLVCLANDGFDLKSALVKDDIFGRSHFNGMHTSYDAHCIAPETIQTDSRLHIEHLSGFILDYFVNVKV